MAPLVSVIVPSYGHEPYVRETLESIFAQTYANVELIVIDDGSRDSSPKIIRDWAASRGARFVRCEVRARANLGLQNTLNEGVLWAMGDFVHIIASDDVLEPQCLERLVDVLQRAGDGVAAACGDSTFIDAASRRVYVEPNGTPVPAPTATTFATLFPLHSRSHPVPIDARTFGTHATLLWGNYIPNANLLRRSAMLEAGLYGGSARIEDFDMWLKLSRRHRFAWTPEALTRYRVHGANQSGVYRESMVRDTINLILREAKHLGPGETLVDVHASAARFVSKDHPRMLLHFLGHENTDPALAAQALGRQTARRLGMRARGLARRLVGARSR